LYNVGLVIFIFSAIESPDRVEDSKEYTVPVGYLDCPDLELAAVLTSIPPGFLIVEGEYC